MNKKPYAWLDGIPDNTSDLHNDAGFLNESEVEEKVTEGIDIENATNGQVLSVTVDGESYSPNWIDAPSGGFDYSTTEFDTGNKWIDGKEIYGIVFTGTTSSTSSGTVYQTYTSNINISRVINMFGFVRGKSTIGGSESETQYFKFFSANTTTTTGQVTFTFEATSGSTSYYSRPYTAWMFYTKNS